MQIQELSEGYARQLRDKSKKEYDTLVRRIVTLETQYQQIQSSVQSTLNRASKIEAIKESQLVEQSKRYKMLKGSESQLQLRKTAVGKAQQLLKQSMVRATEELKDSKYAETQQMKQMSEANRKRILEQRQQEYEAVLLKRESVLVSNEIGKQRMELYWNERMKMLAEARESKKMTYLNQSQTLQLQTSHLERVEAALIQKLQESQKQQHEAVDRLQQVYSSYYDHVIPKPNLETIVPKPTPAIKLPPTQKLGVYDQPLTIHNPSTNRVLSIRGLPKLKRIKKNYSTNLPKMKFEGQNHTPTNDAPEISRDPEEIRDQANKDYDQDQDQENEEQDNQAYDTQAQDNQGQVGLDRQDNQDPQDQEYEDEDHQEEVAAHNDGHQNASPQPEEDEYENEEVEM